MIFHTHFFKESSNDPEIIYCRCGETRDLHRHQWIEDKDIFERVDQNKRVQGYMLKCKICGEFKNHFIYD